MTNRADILHSQLSSIGDGLARAFQTLAKDPRPDVAETLAIQLNGAARHVVALGIELTNEQGKTK